MIVVGGLERFGGLDGRHGFGGKNAHHGGRNGREIFPSNKNYLQIKPVMHT